MKLQDVPAPVAADGRADPSGQAPGARRRVPFGEAARVWVRVALLSFGGPAGQIAVMHRIIVEEKGWIGERRFLHALNYCMLLPGPEAQQLTIYIGWLLHRTAGGLVAGTLFVLPGFCSILALSLLYVSYQQAPAVQAIFFGIKAAVLAIVAEALIRIARRALVGRLQYGLAAAAFVALFAFQVPFPIVIAAAGIVGLARAGLGASGEHPAAGAREEEGGVRDWEQSETADPVWRALRVLGIGLALWLGPTWVVLRTFGPTHVFSEIAAFFSTMAVVTFGGAYAVLSYVAQQGVEHYGWLEPREMLDGLGMAETTPGPLIQVVQFVAFLAAFREPGGMSPYHAAIAASILTTWVTFVPSFIWIFLGAPYVESLRANRWARGALSAITATVVGVIANLAIWFGLHVLFAVVGRIEFAGAAIPAPAWGTADPAAAALAAAAFACLFRFRLGMLATLAAITAAGALLHLARS